ncbi:MAG: DUF5719 family protein [Acidimicrobiia bacterium]
MTGEPAHVRGGRRRRPRVGLDRHALVRRVPALLALGGLLLAGVATDRGGAGGEPAREAAPGAGPVHRLMPVAPAGDGGSTWYCAAGTARDDGAELSPAASAAAGAGDEADEDGLDEGGSDGGADGGEQAPGDDEEDGAAGEDGEDGDGPARRTLTADHTVVVTNASDERRTAVVTVVGGDVARAAGPAPAPAGEPVVEELTVPAHGQAALRLGDVVDAPLAAAVVEVDGGAVVVEHRVAGGHGADAAPCSTTPSPRWHLAWGATTRDAVDLVVLFNPFPSPAIVDATFTTESGSREPVRFQGFPVPARSVVGVDLGDDVRRAERVSATLEVRSGSVVVEHVQAYDGSLGRRGMALTPGAPGAGTTWVFAAGEAAAPSPATPPPGGQDRDEGEEGEDGAAEGGDGAGGEGEDEAPDLPSEEPVPAEQVVVFNPTDERAEVDVSVVPVGDEPQPVPPPFGLSIRAGGHQVVDLGAEDRVPADLPHVTIVRSTNGVPVVAQRVTVDRGPEIRPPGSRRPVRRSELTVALGARVAAPTWHLPDVAGVAGEDDAAVEVAVHNPDPARAVEARLVGGGDGAGDALGDLEPLAVPPGGQVVVELDAEAAAAVAWAVVEADGPVVVERVVRMPDGRRRSAGPGVPVGEGAVPLDELAARGPLGGESGG